MILTTSPCKENVALIRITCLPTLYIVLWYATTFGIVWVIILPIWAPISFWMLYSINVQCLFRRTLQYTVLVNKSLWIVLYFIFYRSQLISTTFTCEQSTFAAAWFRCTIMARTSIYFLYSRVYTIWINIWQYSRQCTTLYLDFWTGMFRCNFTFIFQLSCSAQGEQWRGFHALITLRTTHLG